MGLAFAIDAEKNSIVPTGVTDPGYNSAAGGRGYSISVPPVDLGQHRFRFCRPLFVFWIPPIEGTQRLIDRIGRFLRFRDQTHRQLMHKPVVRSTISGRIDRFLPPLQEPLCIRKRAVVFGVTSRWEKEDFSFDLLCFQFSTLD